MRGESDAMRQLSAVQRCGGHGIDAKATGLAAVTLLDGVAADQQLAAAYGNLAMLALNSNDIDAVRSSRPVRPSIWPTRCGDGDVAVHALNSLGTIHLLSGDDAGLATLLESLDRSLAEGRHEHVGRAYIHLVDVAQRHRHWDLIDRYFTAGAGVLRGARSRPVGPLPPRLLGADRARSGPVGGGCPCHPADRGTPRLGAAAHRRIGRARPRAGASGRPRAVGPARRGGRPGGPVGRAAVDGARVRGPGGDGLAGRPERRRDRLRRRPPGVRRRPGRLWWAGEIAWWRRCAGIDEPVPPDAAEPWALLLAGAGAAAAEAWRRAGCPYEEALALAESDDPDDLRRAFERFDSLGARPAASIVARRMRDAGHPGVPRGVRSADTRQPGRPDAPGRSRCWRCVGTG